MGAQGRVAGFWLELLQGLADDSSGRASMVLRGLRASEKSYGPMESDEM